MGVWTDRIHLVSDSLPELHEFAQKIGLKRDWFQDHPDHPHYDLTSPQMVERALENGAFLASTKMIVLVALVATAKQGEPS